MSDPLFEEKLQEIQTMSENIVEALKKDDKNPPVDTCLSALGDVLIDICQFLGLNKLGFVDVCRQLIEQYEDSPHGTDAGTA